MLSMLKRILQDKHLLQIRLFMWFAKKKIQAFGREYTKDYHSYYELVEEQDNNVTPQGFNVEFMQNDGDLNDVTVLISRKGKKWSTLSNLTVEELTHLKNELVEYLKIEKP